MQTKILVEFNVTDSTLQKRGPNADVVTPSELAVLLRGVINRQVINNTALFRELELNQIKVIKETSHE